MPDMINVKTSLFVSVLIGTLLTDAPAQAPVLVAESTLKVSAFSEEEFYYGFAAGDQVIFSFREMNGKPLKELEIKEVPGNAIFMDYKTGKISNKNMLIQRTGIYKFRFQNDGIVGRVCKFKIQRVPAHDTLLNFNTSVYWRTQYDTTYTPEEERYLVKTDTIATVVTDQVAKVSSQNAANGNTNRAVVDFTLPDGTASWSYYIGVGTVGSKAYEASKDKFIHTASASAMKIPGYGSLVGLALLGVNVFSKAGGGDNVKYWFITDWANVSLFKAGQTFYQYKQGDVINDVSQMRSPTSGKVYIGLENDNILDAIEVTVKVVSIQIRKTWGTRTVNRMNVESKKIPYLKS
jgi:hypothetical protein